MACWIDDQCQVYLAKKVKTCPHCDVNPREPKSETNTIFFQSELEDVPNP